MLQFTLGFPHSKALKKCVMICIHQSAMCFHYLKILYFPVFHSYLFNCFLSFAFPECHIVGIMPYVASSDCLLSLSNMRLKILHVFWWFDIAFHFNTKYYCIGRKRRKTKQLECERGEWKSWLKTQHSKSEDHGIQSHNFIENRETVETVTDFLSLGSKSLQRVTVAMKLMDTCSLEEKFWLT